jgi:hypothetical protein
VRKISGKITDGDWGIFSVAFSVVVTPVFMVGVDDILTSRNSINQSFLIKISGFSLFFKTKVMALSVEK